MEWSERIQNYVRQTGFPNSLFIAADGRVVGTWIMGNKVVPCLIDLAA